MKKQKIKLIIIDYINLITPPTSQKSNEYWEKQIELMQQLKYLSKNKIINIQKNKIKGI